MSKWLSHVPWRKRLIWQLSTCLLSDQKREGHADWRRQQAQRSLNWSVSGLSKRQHKIIVAGTEWREDRRRTRGRRMPGSGDHSEIGSHRVHLGFRTHLYLLSVAEQEWRLD